MTDAWEEDLSPIGALDWTPERARHLLNRAGFGGPPDEVARLAAMPPEKAVAWFIDFKTIDNTHLAPFEHSGIYDPSLTPFPPTRPAATRLAEETGSAMGVDAKPTGPRRLQPVADRFFFWLRASMLETRRVANWWADRMVATNRPLQEKLALFWHGHFASSEEKVRDYRKMLGQVQLFQEHAAGNFGTLLSAVARDPAMLVYLDAGQNLKGRPNENFGRELMELFTMGVGNYTEQDLREAARAFTGWRDNDLSFHIDAAQHDDGQKTVLGHTGPLGGQEVLDIILAQPATSNFIAGKLYRFLVRDELSSQFQGQLGDLLRANNYEIAPFLRTVFLSRDFYSPDSIGTHIKGPVELIVSTYRRLGLAATPGMPDFNSTSTDLGQALLNPSTVAGWSQGRAWITPGSLLARGNFARAVLLPDVIAFTDPNLDPYPTQVRAFSARIRAGDDIATASKIVDGADSRQPQQSDMAAAKQQAGLATANLLSEHEEFNTHYASLKGWEEAVRRVKPTPRGAAQFSLTTLVLEGGARSSGDAVDCLVKRFLSVPLDPAARSAAVSFLEAELGTTDLDRAKTYLEEPLRLTAHLIMSTPEYQLA
ncbi:MAG TPA: DUF1800 domain-containing protein [Roseiarcus sp.]|jgi:hypothetical protein|nr:DUF1800 domain-containing protein [Roseiarcus sp.]